MASCPRSEFDLGSGGGDQVQSKVLGRLGSSTPRDLAHPRQPAPTCSWGGGSRWGPLVTNRASGRSWPCCGEMAIIQTLLSGKSLHHTAPSWEQEQKKPGRHGARGLPPSVWVGGGYRGSSQPGSRWECHTWAVLRLGQG